MAGVPVVDFSAYSREHSYNDKAKVAKEIDEAFRSLGFVYLKNHGVQKEKVEQCFEWVRCSSISSPEPPLTSYPLT